jgi:methylated-DNA-protein-cysteine methyltransferase-like protein
VSGKPRQPGAKKPKTKQPAADGFGKVFERIYRLVLRIPPGRVMTYGQISRLMDERYSPRLVGWAMHATPRDGRDIPWHRVINSRGSISTGRVILEQPNLQKFLLEAEGVRFDDRGRCDLRSYQWSPTAKAYRAAILRAGGVRKSDSRSNARTPAAPKRKRKGETR